LTLRLSYIVRSIQIGQPIPDNRLHGVRAVRHLELRDGRTNGAWSAQSTSRHPQVRLLSVHSDHQFHSAIALRYSCHDWGHQMRAGTAWSTSRGRRQP